jgi:hypothetical protein
MKRLLAAILLVSMALLGFEITLMQVFSLVQWHHFAAMIISIALLGFGASGTAITLGRRWLLARFDRVVPLTLSICSLSMVSVVPLTQLEVVRFDSYLVFLEAGHAASLVLTYLLLALPFFFGATVIGLSFVRFTAKVGILYFWNLLGSGIGALVGVLAMQYVEPVTMIAAFGGLVAASDARTRCRGPDCGRACERVSHPTRTISVQGHPSRTGSTGCRASRRPGIPSRTGSDRSLAGCAECSRTQSPIPR